MAYGVTTIPPGIRAQRQVNKQLVGIPPFQAVVSGQKKPIEFDKKRVKVAFFVNHK